jgi:hypothetical protein
MDLTVTVTPTDIRQGTDRPASCPIALAATRALRRRLPRRVWRRDYHVEFEPYRAFCKPEGLTVRRGGDVLARIPVEDCPEEAYEFASQFDDWFRGEPEGDAPDCPGPFAFTLHLEFDPDSPVMEDR